MFFRVTASYDGFSAVGRRLRRDFADRGGFDGDPVRRRRGLGCPAWAAPVSTAAWTPVRSAVSAAADTGAAREPADMRCHPFRHDGERRHRRQPHRRRNRHRPNIVAGRSGATVNADTWDDAGLDSRAGGRADAGARRDRHRRSCERAAYLIKLDTVGDKGGYYDNWECRPFVRGGKV